MSTTWMSPGAGTRLSLIVWLAGLVGFSGCMHVEFTKPAWPTWFDSKPEAPPEGPVAEVVAVWRDGLVVLPDPANGGAPTPGFMGKICLAGMEGFNVAADGPVTIHLYDDQQTPTNPPVPREMWTIPPEILKTVLKKESPLGWTYTLWLPWSNYSPKVSQTTLVVQYKDKTGREVWGKPYFMTVRDQEGIRQPSQMQVNNSEQRLSGK